MWNSWRTGNPTIRPDLAGAHLSWLARQPPKLLGEDWVKQSEDQRRRNEIQADLRRFDLSNVDLEGCDLGRADLSEANLSHAILRDVSFDGSILRGSNLLEAYARSVRFVSADCSSACFHATDLNEATFKETVLDATEMNGAQFLNTSLIGVDLATAIGLDSVRHLGPSIIDVQTIFRSSGRISRLFLRGAGMPEQFITYVDALTEHPIEFYSCFISYSHADKPFARRLHDTLQARGIRCWLDEQQLYPGDPLYEHINRGIRLWDKFLLCCSESSLSPSSWVEKEITIAFEKEDQLTKRAGTKVQVLVPLNLDGYLFSERWESGFSAQIRSRLAADFSGWEKDNKKFEFEVERLIRALRADSRARELPPNPRL